MHPIIRYWRRIHALPGGSWLFDRLFGLYIPYTGSMGSRIQAMEPGYARVELPDRRRVRNHLRSIHAIALANLAELTGNLAMVCALPRDARLIVAGLSIEYLKKARGRIVAESRCPIPPDNQRREYEIPVTLRNGEGDVVARATIRSLVGPQRD